MVMPVVSVLNNGRCMWRDAADTQRSYCSSWWQPVREKQSALRCRCNGQCALVVIPGGKQRVTGHYEQKLLRENAKPRNKTATGTVAIVAQTRALQELPIAACVSFYRKRMVGVTGFEPTTPTSRTWCSTKLSYTPTVLQLLRFSGKKPQLRRLTA